MLKLVQIYFEVLILLKTQKLQAIVPESLKTWYKVQAARNGKTLNVVLIEALTEYQERNPSTPEKTSNWRTLCVK